MRQAPLVLVIDDTLDQRELLRAHLRKAGYRVEAAATLGEAEASMRREAPDVAIIDLLLGDESGWDARDRVHALAPDAAIVIASVLDTDDYPDADAVLPKPFTGAQVRSVIARLCGAA